MRIPLGISLFMHVAIIVLAIWRLTGPDKLIAPPQEALPVEIVDISEVSKRAAMRKDAKEPPKKAERPAPPKEVRKEVKKPAPKPAREVKQAAREPAPAPEPKPEPEKKPQPKPEPKPSKEADAALDALVKKVAKAEKKPQPEKKPKKVARPKVKPRPRPKIVRRKPKPTPKKVAKRETKKKPKDAIDEIAALLNKTDEQRAAPQPKTTRTGTPLKGPANINGDDARIAADLADALRSRIEQCWNIPAGVRDAENLRVRVRFQLGPGGEVTGGPVVLNSMNHPAFPAAAQSAVRAVLACAPYAFLPPDRYDLWRDVILTFDPSRVLAVN